MHGAFVPPREFVEEIVTAVDAVRAPASVEEASPRRFGFRRASATIEDTPPIFEALPYREVRLPVSGFGNLTNGDALRLKDAIATSAAEWSPARVSVGGVALPDFPRDRSLLARLDGDTDALIGIARGVMRCVERLGFFVDRRQLRPMLKLGVMSGVTDPQSVTRVIDALDGFQGREWIVDSVVLTAQVFAGPAKETREFERIPLG